MMFSSKTPRDLNHDPYPNVWDGHTPFNQMRADHDKFRKGAPVGRIGEMVYLHRPRPEYDHVQHNESNPILVDFREMRGIAELWLDAIEGEDGDVFLAGAPKELGYVNADHIDHALRVLERLVRLTKGSAA